MLETYRLALTAKVVLLESLQQNAGSHPKDTNWLIDRG
jgi:hypothetical protein